MTLEPSHCRTVSIRPVMPPDDEANTLEKYQANIARRFGKDGKMPSWADLAKRENAARLRACGQHVARQERPSLPGNGSRPGAGEYLVRTPEQEQRRLKNLRATLNAKTETKRQRIMAALRQPKTANDIATETGLGRNVVVGYLSEALSLGLVSKTKLKRVAIWELTAPTLPKAARVLTATPQGGAA